MTKTWTLFKTLMKNTRMFSFTKNRLLNAVLIGLIVIGLVPLVLLLSFITVDMYGQLEGVGQEGALVAFILVGMNFAMFFFGAFYILNVFYFSKDIENLLYMPFKASHILMAKLLTVIAYEYFFVLLFYVPVMIAYGYASGGGVIFYILAILIGLMLPFIPLVLASLIVMVVMRFTNIGKHKETVGFIAGMVILVVAIGFNVLIQNMAGGNADTQELMEYMTTDGGLMNFVARFFPGVRFATLVISSESIVIQLQNLAIHVGIIYLMVLLFLWVANRIYFAGAVGLSDVSAKRQQMSEKEWTKNSRQESMLLSVMHREFRLLLRSPVYFMNGVFVSVLVPGIFIFFYLVMPDNDQQMQALMQLMQQDGSGAVTLAIVFVSGIVFSGMNAVASTGVTREGRGVVYMRFLPMKMQTFYMGKVVVSMILGYLGVILIGIVFHVMGASATPLILGAILAILGTGISSQLGMCIDLIHPKLEWDNEQQAMKQNVNVIINMLISGVLTFGIVYGVLKVGLAFMTTALLLLFVGVLINILLYATVGKGAIAYFENQDY